MLSPENNNNLNFYTEKTGFEPATYNVTSYYSNQLSYFSFLFNLLYKIKFHLNLFFLYILLKFYKLYKKKRIQKKKKYKHLMMI